MRILVAGIALALGGCATITRGTEEIVMFQSDPPGALVRTSIGLGCPETPCGFTVARKLPFVATLSKPGYKDQTVEVISEMSVNGGAGLAGNVLFGGVIGIGTDAATGATLDHKPNPVSVVLEPVAPPVSPPPLKPSGKKLGKSPEAGT